MRPSNPRRVVVDVLGEALWALLREGRGPAPLADAGHPAQAVHLHGERSRNSNVSKTIENDG